MPRQLVFFSDARIALNKEIQRHSRLVKMLEEFQGVRNWPATLGVVGIYLGIAFDTTFNAEELEKLEGQLVLLLRKKGIIIVH